MGMLGGLTLPGPIPREAIRREGERLGYQGTALDDFTEAIVRVDDKFIELETRKAAADVKASADKNKRR